MAVTWLTTSRHLPLLADQRVGESHVHVEGLST